MSALPLFPGLPGAKEVRPPGPVSLTELRLSSASEVVFFAAMPVIETSVEAKLRPRRGLWGNKVTNSQADAADRGLGLTGTVRCSLQEQQ